MAASDPPAAAPGFVGRTSELHVLRQCASRARDACPWVVRVLGAAGIGKTTLVRQFLGELDEFTVLAAPASRTWQADAYGVLNMLLSAHRMVLDPTDATAVSAAATLLATLDELQGHGPVAVVVDDVQWVDHGSARALEFVLRWLGADRVLVVLVRRDESTGTARTSGLDAPRDNTTEIRLGGLSAPEVAALVEAHVGGVVTGPAARWMRSRTGGHPLYVRALVADGTLPPATAGPPSCEPTLDATVVEWFRTQPAPTRRLLEALAVVDTRLPLLRLARLAGVNDPATALEPAVTAGFVDRWPADPAGPVAFRHPLHREAVYAALTPRRRGDLHHAAVAFVDRRRGWAHRVAAATGTDDELAGELERSAAEEDARGECATAAVRLRWAAQLSADRDEYERRLLTGCLMSLRVYHTAWAHRVSAEIAGCTPSPLRSCVDGVLALLRDNDLTRAEELFADAIAGSTPHPELAWVRGTAAAYLAALHLWRGRGRETVETASLALAAGDPDPLTTDTTRMVLAVGRSRCDGWSAALHDLRHLPADPADAGRHELESLACRGALHAMIGDLAVADDDLSAVVRAHRAGGRCTLGYTAFAYLSAVQYLRGEWDDSALTAYQGLVLVEGAEQGFHRALMRLAAGLVPVGRGDERTATTHLIAARQRLRTLDTPQDRRYVAIAGAVHAQATADHRRMLAALHPLRRDATGQERAEHTWWQLWWRPLLVEALTEAGDPAEAQDELAELHRIARHVPYLASTLGRLDGRLAERRGRHGAALDRYEEAAADAAGDADPPLHRGMLEAALGRLHLERARPDAAAGHLSAAHRRFDALGAVPFARRCAADLARCGADPGRGTPSHPPLSERERQVAGLVERGMTNREIAAELFLSTKTIEYHLANIFTKLGITSRRQLRRSERSERWGPWVAD